MTKNPVPGLIIDHESPWIGHQEFEGGSPRSNHIVHRNFRRSGQVGNSDMKAVIDNGLTLGFSMPDLQSFSQRMAALLVGKIEDSGGATTGGGDSARLKIIAGNGGGQRKLHMGMHIYGTWKDVFIPGIKHCISLQVGKRTW